MATKSRRKVLRVGTSLVITIPKAFVTYNEIKPGDPVEIVTTGKHINIEILERE